MTHHKLDNSWPWPFLLERDPGDYVGRHRISDYWVTQIRYVNNRYKTFRRNLTGGAFK